MRKSLLDELPQPATVDAALKALEQNFAAGTDGTKLFIATPQADGSIKRMSADVMRAAAEATHRRGQLVFVHPTDFIGVQAALDAHVDILAHPPLGQSSPWPEALLKQVRDAGMAMIPTLELLPFELQKEQVPPQIAKRVVNESVQEFGRFAAMGGQILFGTDVGYMTDFDPTLEYELMAQAGMTPMQILASLTIAPAARWHEQGRRGRLAAGMDADIVVLNADPADSPRNFADVRCVIRGGEVIYERHYSFASDAAAAEWFEDRVANLDTTLCVRPLLESASTDERARVAQHDVIETPGLIGSERIDLASLRAGMVSSSSTPERSAASSGCR
ncbi:MAG TPA: amidohydrolase family protein, partial [Vicinamibacterales bacterium]|nr:amidohydrolase family protein [Vicinamibacterales bacterium]